MSLESLARALLKGVGEKEKDRFSPKYDNSATDEAGSSSLGLDYADKNKNDFVKGIRKLTLQDHISDPGYLGYKIFFDWYNSPLFRGTLNQNGLQEESQNYPVDSALGYLTRIGETTRAQYLKDFVNKLFQINLNMPWYFQEIDGLEGVWDSYNDHHANYFGGSDSKITIETLETLDLSIAGMINLYRAALHQPAFDRQIIPTNLRKFNMYLYIYDQRTFHSKHDIVGNDGNYIIDGTNPNDNNMIAAQFLDPLGVYDWTKDKSQRDEISREERSNSSVRKLNGLIPYTIYLGDCTFDPKGSPDIFSNVSNVAPEQSKNKVVINYRDIKITQDLPWLNYSIDDDPVVIDKYTEKSPINPEMPVSKNHRALASTIEKYREEKIEDEKTIMGTAIKAAADAAKRKAFLMARKAAYRAANIAKFKLKELASDSIRNIKGNLGISANNVFGRVGNNLLGALGGSENIGDVVNVLTETAIGTVFDVASENASNHLAAGLNNVLDTVSGIDTGVEKPPAVNVNANSADLNNYADIINSNINDGQPDTDGNVDVADLGNILP
jgi:hypothetical protein